MANIKKIINLFNKTAFFNNKKETEDENIYETANRKKIGDILKEDFGVEESETNRIIDEMKKNGNGKKFGEVAVEIGVVSEETIYKALMIQNDFELHFQKSFESLKELFLRYPSLHKDYIENKFKDKLYLETIDDLDGYFNVLEIKNPKDGEPYLLLQDKGNGKRFVGLFIPSFFVFDNDSEVYFDDIVIIGPQLYNYISKFTKNVQSEETTLKITI